ncbi:MAG: anti-sigma factor family protein [Peptococcaceae bacterium]
MNCRPIKPKIYQYAQGTLAEKEQALVKDHLVRCQNCLQDYLEWLELECMFAEFAEQEPPQNLTPNIMNSIARISAAGKNKAFWLANYCRNFARGLVVAGILGLVINYSSLIIDLPIESTMEMGLQAFEEAGSKYFQIYEKVSNLSLDNWKIKGGNSNEM